MDIDGGGVDDPPDRDPITGPLGVLLCGGAGALDVGLGADVGCGCVGPGSFDGTGAFEPDDPDDGTESSIDPSLGRSPCPAPPPEPCSSGAPLGRSAPGPPELLVVDDTTAFFVNCPGGWLTGLLQAAQTRAAATAVAAALAGATVPRIGMDATVAK